MHKGWCRIVLQFCIPYRFDLQEKYLGTLYFSVLVTTSCYYIVDSGNARDV